MPGPVLDIKIKAATASALNDMELLNAKVETFSGSVTGARTSMVAATTAIHGLEGGITSSTRAVGRFLVDTLKLGPALQAAFPVIGAIAFAATLAKITVDVAKFFNDTSKLGDKIQNSFFNAGASIRLTTDELKVANDRLDNDIAKLEGKRQNNLKLALDEATLSADKLGDSMSTVVKEIDDLIKKNKPDFVESIGSIGRFISGAASPSDIGRSLQAVGIKDTAVNEYFGDNGTFANSITNIRRSNRQQLRQIDTSTDYTDEQKVQQKIYANNKTNVEYAAAYKAGLDVLDTALATADDENEKKRIQGIKDRLEDEQDKTQALLANAAKTTKNQALQLSHEDEEARKAVPNRIAELDAALAGARAKAEGVGQPEAIKAVTDAKAAYEKVIAELNKLLKDHNLILEKGDAATIKNRITTIATVEEDNKWRESLIKSNQATDQRIAALQRLKDAFGEGFEAEKQARIANQLAQEFSPEKVAGRDPNKVRIEFLTAYAKLNEEADKEHDASQNETLKKLDKQIQLEKAVAAARLQGEVAVREARLAAEIATGGEHGAAITDPEQIKRIRELAAAIQLGATNEEIKKLSDEKNALDAVTKAALDGAEAQRIAAARAKAQATSDKFGAPTAQLEIAKDLSAEQNKTAIAAGNVLNKYKEQLTTLAKEREVLENASDAQKNTIDYAIALRDIENQHLKILAEQQLAYGSLQSGVRAFFLEMEESAKTAGQIVYDALHSALDKVSDELAKLITREKTNFAKLFQDIGRGIVKESIGSIIHTTLGEIGKHIPGLGGKGGPPKTFADLQRKGQSAQDAWWVQIAGAGLGGNRPGGPILHTPGGPDQGTVGEPIPQSTNPAPKNGWLASIFSSLLQSLFQKRASGGPVSPGQAYLVGERGPEPFVPSISGSIISNANSRYNRGPSQAPLYSIGSIDARGTDSVSVRQSVIQAIANVHQSAAVLGVQAMIKRSDRVPPSASGSSGAAFGGFGE